MNTLTVYGYSDDLIEFKGVDVATDSSSGYEESVPLGPDRGAEFSVGKDYKARFLINKQMLLFVEYPPNPSIWRFAVSRIDQSIDYPDWEVRTILHESGYSMQLEIDIRYLPVTVEKIPYFGHIILNEETFIWAVRDLYLSVLRKALKAYREVHFGKEHVERWGRVCATLGKSPKRGLTLMTSDEADGYIKTDERWREIASALQGVEELARKNGIVRSDIPIETRGVWIGP